VYADPIINIDGILYIRAAEAFSRGDTETALSIYKWPFYPYLIHTVHEISGVEPILAAHLLNAVFNISSCIVFVLLIREFGGAQRTLLIASVVIVLFPGLNEIRSYIVRDHGYILFYLSALLFLVKALQARSVPKLVASVFCMVTAMLFRIEGLVFLVAIPLIYLNSVLHIKPTTRTGRIVVVAIVAILLVAAFGWWFHTPEEVSDHTRFSLETIGEGWNQAFGALEAKIETLKSEIINTSSSSIARLVFLWSAIGIILAQVLVILSVPYTILAGYAFKKDLVFPNNVATKPWALFVFCNVVILFLFTLTWFFVTDRYPLALVVTLLATVPFALDQLYERWRSRGNGTTLTKLGYGLLAVILFFNCLEGLTSYSDKRYLRESGFWLRDNAHPTTRLFTNDPVIGFYSGLPGDKVTTIEDRGGLLDRFYRGKWIDYDYVALQIDPDPGFEHHLKKTLWVVPEKVFVNERSKEVRIYNIKKHRERKDQ
jgi:hypothetical protein